MGTPNALDSQVGCAMLALALNIDRWLHLIPTYPTESSQQPMLEQIPTIHCDDLSIDILVSR